MGWGVAEWGGVLLSGVGVLQVGWGATEWGGVLLSGFAVTLGWVEMVLLVWVRFVRNCIGVSWL